MPVVQAVGINFHEGLKLTRARLATVLRYVEERSEASKDSLHRDTEIRSNMAVAIPNLGRACGFLALVRTGTVALTDLGRAVVKTDPYLERTSTSWLIHFGMVDPGGPGPRYWRGTMLDLLPHNSEVDIDELIPKLSQNETVVPDKVRLALGKLVQAYTASDLLGGLGMMRVGDKAISLTAPNSAPSLGVFAYAVAARWEALHPRQLTAGLDGFFQDSRLLDIFRLSRGEAEGLLERLARRGDVELYQTAPPHQIVRKWDSLADVVARLDDDAA